MDATPHMPSRQRVASFDLYDTLIARRCVHPHHVFHIIANTIGLAGFPELRMRAQDMAARRCAPADYTLATIYEDFATLTGRSAQDAGMVMRLESEIELDQVFPIQENLARVRPQDIIVSDMYLGHDVLQRILREKLGLWHNPLFVSCGGKGSGLIWPQLQQRYDLSLHLGDNPHTDIATARPFGIPTELTNLSDPLAIESYLARTGLPTLATSIREARLVTWHPEPQTRALQLGQILANFPFLVLVALDLVQQVRETGAKRLLLSGRDCHRLSFLMPALLQRYGLDCTSTYFHSSRVARLGASEAYIGHFNDLRGGERTIVADLCGSGRSLECLLDAAGHERTTLYLAHHNDQPGAFPRIYETLGRLSCPLEALLSGTYPWLALELLNTAPHPYVIDMARWQDRFVPVFAEGGLDGQVLDAIKVQDEAFAKAAGIFLARPERDPVLDRGRRREVAGTVYNAMPAFVTPAMASLHGLKSHEEELVSSRVASRHARTDMTPRCLSTAGA